MIVICVHSDVAERENCSKKLGGSMRNICLCFDSSIPMKETLFLLRISYSTLMCPAVIIFHDMLFGNEVFYVRAYKLNHEVFEGLEN